MKKKNVMVLFGGVSSEHEVSRVSASSVLEHVDREKYNIITAGITREGLWFETPAGTDEIASGEWEKNPGNREISLVPGRGFKGFDVDVVLPMLHGRNGEDGRMQGFLTIAGVPFVGSGSTASAACMDKAVTKAMVDQAEICRQAECCVAHRGCDTREAADVISEYFQGKYPLFVKPANAGSSVGISKVRTKQELPEALNIAFAEDDKALVEEAIEGREIEVAVLEIPDEKESTGRRIITSRIGEIFAANEFYDYTAKYDNIGSKTGLVTDLPQELEQEIRETAAGIFEIMGCRGLARVDFFLEPGNSGGYEDGRPVFNEINTLPGFTEISMYPQLWEATGIPYSELIDKLIEMGSDI